MPADLGEVREVILVLREEIRLLKAGELDESLFEVANYAIVKSDRFDAIESLCNLPDKPQITEKQVAEAMSEAGEVSEERKARALLMRLWKGVNSHKYASPFRKPVNPRDAPTYASIIKSPMDLATLKKNIENGSVTEVDQFNDAISLICNNAKEFNGDDSDYGVYAQELQEFSEELIKIETAPKEEESAGNEGDGTDTSTRTRTRRQPNGETGTKRKREDEAQQDKDEDSLGDEKGDDEANTKTDETNESKQESAEEEADEEAEEQVKPVRGSGRRGRGRGGGRGGISTRRGRSSATPAKKEKPAEKRSTRPQRRKAA